MANRSVLIACVGCWILMGFALSSLQAQKVELVKELSIGTIDGPPEYAFGRYFSLAPTAAQGFYIFDGDDTQIRRYDSKGQFLGLVGRSGAGPGEYRQISGMAAVGDSLFLVYDPANNRISVFDSAGKYQRQIALTGIRKFYGEKMFALDRNGLIAIRAATAGGGHEGMSVASQYLRMRLDGTVVDSLPVPSEATVGRPFVLITADGERWSFPERTVFTLLGDGGLATARTTTYRISVAPRQGEPFVIERPDRPLPLVGAERAEWEAWIRYFAGRPQAGPGATLPRVKPLIRDLFVDDSGRFWVGRYVTAVKRNIPPRPAGDARPLLTIREVNNYDMFDSHGLLLGNVSLPSHAMLLAVRGDRVYVRQEAEAGEYKVERYAIRVTPR